MSDRNESHQGVIHLKYEAHMDPSTLLRQLHGTYLAGILVHAPAILNEIFCDFLQSLLVNNSIVP
jgi:hypothetical protein